jgi:hypothetical protein
MDCVSNGFGRSWFPVTSYRWKCLAFCAHPPAFSTHPQISRVKMWGRGSSHYFIASHSCLPISSAVSGANLIFTHNCLVFYTFQILRTAGSGYIDTLKEQPGFKEEPVVIWLIQIVFLDHGLYRNKWVFDISENCDDEPSTSPWYPVVQFIIPAQQWSTSLVSHRSSQDSLPRHHRYIYLQIG